MRKFRLLKPDGNFDFFEQNQIHAGISKDGIDVYVGDIIHFSLVLISEDIDSYIKNGGMSRREFYKGTEIILSAFEARVRESYNSRGYWLDVSHDEAHDYDASYGILTKFEDKRLNVMLNGSTYINSDASIWYIENITNVNIKGHFI